MEFFIAYLHEPKPPSVWKEGNRLRWRMENLVGCESTLHVCVRPTLHCPANQLGSPAITHRWRGPPSFRERGLCFVAVSCQLAGPGGYHPPLAWSPLFQRKRALYVRYPSFSFHTLALLCTHGAPADLLVVARHTIDTTLEHGSGAHYFERR